MNHVCKLSCMMLRGRDKQHKQKVPVLRITMISNKREVIDLLSKDDSVHSVITSSANQSTPQSKKRPPFLPLNGQNHHKTRATDFDKGKESPRSCMRRLLQREDSNNLFLFSQYKKHTVSFSSDTPMCHSYTPIVTDPVIQQSIFWIQVGQALDAMDDTVHLLLRFMRNFIFIQPEPYKNDKGVYYTPHDQSWSRSSCQLHTDSKFLFCFDLGPSRYAIQSRTARQKTESCLPIFSCLFGRLPSNWVMRRLNHSGCTASGILAETAWGNMPTALASN